MTRIDIIFSVLLISLLIISSYFFIRNNGVYRFKTMLNDTGWSILHRYLKEAPISADNEVYNAYMAEHGRMRDIWFSINDISYDKMLFSFKPLSPRYWLNEEQLKFLNYYDTERPK